MAIRREPPRQALPFESREWVSWLRLLFLTGISERDRIPILIRNLLQVSILRAVDRFHDFDGNRLADGLREIRPCYPNFSEPSRRVSLEFSAFYFPVITLFVHVDNDMWVDPVPLCDGDA